MLQHRATVSFWKTYHALAPEVQQRANKQFSYLKAEPQHRSLQFKKIGERGADEIWSARVTLNYRALAVKRSYGFLWFWIGDHESYENLLS
jgi:hypothetical protein